MWNSNIPFRGTWNLNRSFSKLYLIERRARCPGLRGGRGGGRVVAHRPRTSRSWPPRSTYLATMEGGARWEGARAPSCERPTGGGRRGGGDGGQRAAGVWGGWNPRRKTAATVEGGGRSGCRHEGGWWWEGADGGGVEGPPWRPRAGRQPRQPGVRQPTGPPAVERPTVAAGGGRGGSARGWRDPPPPSGEGAAGVGVWGGSAAGVTIGGGYATHPRSKTCGRRGRPCDTLLQSREW